jgi:hypothetical protein
MTRYFAFGCSYTDYRWMMLPDFIGVNYDHYYNFGRSGACHSFMLNMLVQANELYKFNPDTDYITIGTTGFGRYSYVEHGAWVTSGDIFPEHLGHPDKARLFAREFDSYEWAVYRSLSNLKTMKLLLTTLNIKHTIYKSLFNKELDPVTLERQPQSPLVVNMINEFDSIVDIKPSVDEQLVDYLSTRGEYNHPWINGHPTLNVSYAYLKKHFPQEDTQAVKDIYERETKLMFSGITEEKYKEHFSKNVLRVHRTDLDLIQQIKNTVYYVTA